MYIHVYRYFLVSPSTSGLSWKFLGPSVLTCSGASMLRKQETVWSTSRQKLCSAETSFLTWHIFLGVVCISFLNFYHFLVGGILILLFEFKFPPARTSGVLISGISDKIFSRKILPTTSIILISITHHLNVEIMSEVIE